MGRSDSGGQPCCSRTNHDNVNRSLRQAIAYAINKEAIKAFEDHKAKVVTLSDADYNAWLEVAKKSSYAEFAKAVPNGQKLIDEALAVK